MNQELICYNTDGSRIIGNALKVVFPENVEEIKKVVFNNQNIVPRGSGSNFVGSCVPNNSVVIDMKKMNKVSFENGKVYAESGVTMKELNEKLKSVDFEFPVFSNEERTIGGMIAMNSNGYLGRYGNIKEWIEEIELVNGKGEVVKIGKADLSDVCGMEGITGIITKARLKAIYLQKRSASIFQAETLEDIWSIARRLKLQEDVVMLRFYSKSVSKLMGFSQKYHLFVGFNSERGKIKGEDYNNILKNIKKEYYYLSAQGYYDTDDVKFFFDKIKGFVSFLEELKVLYFSDLSSGSIYLFFIEQDINKQNVLKMIQRMGGRPGSYGTGIKRKNILDNIQKKIIQRIKSRYDPHGKLNQGKLIDFLAGAKEKNWFKKEINNEVKEERSIEEDAGKMEDNYSREGFVEEKLEKSKEDLEIEKKEIEKKNEELIERKEELMKEPAIKYKEFEIVTEPGAGKVKISDNLRRKAIISENEKELINKIMFNKLDNKEDSKKEQENKNG
ncbi:MAG: FAD-binding oxidoreductase [Nanoarchaeota archaeon]